MKIHYLLIIFVFVGTLSAQKKATPPPTRMALPSDTLQTRDKSQAKVKSSDESLDLPDVTIYGQDETQVEIDVKKDFTEEKPTLYKPNLEYDPVSVLLAQESAKPGYTPATSTMDRMFWAGILGGGYTTILADAGYWGKLQRGDFRMDAVMDYSKGQHENSQHLDGEIKGSLHYRFSPTVKSNSYLLFGNHDQGMYQYNFSSDAERTTRRIKAGSEFSLRPWSNGSSNLGFDITSLGMEESNIPAFNDQYNYFHYRLYGDYAYQLTNWQLHLYGSYDHETWKENDWIDTPDARANQIGARLRFQPSPLLAITAGLGYQQLEYKQQDEQFGPLPYAQIKVVPVKSTSISLSYTNGFEYQTLANWLADNPFYKPVNMFYLDEYNHKINLNLQVEPTEKMKFHANLEYADLKSKVWWGYTIITDEVAPTPYNILPQLINFKDVKIFSLEMGNTFHINDISRIQAGIIYTNSKQGQNNQVNDMLPYMPEIQVPVRFVIEPVSGTTITADVTYTSERNTNRQFSEKLDAYSLFNLGVSQRLGRFTAQLQARNLLDAEYSVWHYFPQNGVNLLAGISARF